MRVLHITATDSNGAGIAALRIVQAQRQFGLNSSIIVREKHSKFSYVIAKYRFKYLDYLLNIFLKLFGLDYIFSLNGFFIVNSNIFKEADIIHIHNIHHVRLLHPVMLPRNKKYVYTLHDMWAITGNCNYNFDVCDRYITGCYSCPLNKKATEFGFPSMFIENTRFQWRIKQSSYNKLDIYFVSPSRWLANRFMSSKIAYDKRIDVVPNCFEDLEYNNDNELTKRSSAIIRILFVGQKVRENDRKGFYYVVEVLNQLKIEHELHVVGLMNENFQTFFDNPKTKIIYHGPVNADNMKYHYANNDVLLLPSLQDNYPNTIIEALFYGMPVVSFDIGGISEIVNKSNGYLAPYKNSQELLMGIYYVFENLEQLSIGALHSKSIFSNSRNYRNYQRVYEYILKQ